MAKSDLEKKFVTYGKQVSNLSCKKREENILKIMELESKTNQRNTNLSFAFTQIKMVTKHCIVWQVLWLVTLVFCFKKGFNYYGIGNSQMALISVFTPLVALLTVNDVAKIFQRSMLEIECTTKYRIADVMLVRFLSISIMNFIFVFIGLSWISRMVEVNIGSVLLYGFTPMFVSNALLLVCMQIQKGEELQVISMVIYSFILAICLAGNIWNGINIYKSSYQTIWGAVGIVALIIEIVVLYYLRKEWNTNGVDIKQGYQKV